MKLLHVVGARPNFMKVGPVIHALRSHTELTQVLVHTGQHYDANMSDIFFTQLGLPAPDINLEIGSGSHAVQTAQTMIAFEKVVLEHRPDWVLVYGDVNSTVAVTLVCAKLGIRVAHVEAGLRSFDRTMPEEINRLITDQIADLLLTPSADGDQNLLREGIAPEKIRLVGNVMIDTLVRLRPQAEAHWPALQQQFGLARYGLITLHRPSNVDEPAMLRQILTTLNEIAADLPLLFPIHPRTRQRIQGQGLADLAGRIQFCDPLGYLEFLALQAHATIVLTDSGGVQEETTYLQVPCLTLRENTERPVTVDVGSNTLVGHDMAKLRHEVARTLQGDAKQGAIPPLWDGRAGERIAQIITQHKRAL
ncbi:MAG: UDP-N-acetylglucosamine 2-epimerase (non-hydrolyzing) [Caldilineaceae bacterium]|nr:UDP-N-acetylglucosamine 2-epimerase (non-hydrolyzing) [Caldilineaceae bacterium]